MLRNPNEIEPTTGSTNEVLTKVYQQVDRHQVKFVQCVFVQREDLENGIMFFIEGIFSKTSFEQCEVVSHVDGGWPFVLDLFVGNDTSEHCNALSAVDFHIHNSTFYNFHLSVNAKTCRSFAFI